MALRLRAASLLLCVLARGYGLAAPCERAGRPGERQAAMKWVLPQGALCVWIEPPASEQDDYALVACDCRTGKWERVQRLSPARDNASIEKLKLRFVGEGATRRELLFTSGMHGGVGETTLAFRPTWDEARMTYRLVKVLDDRSRLLIWDKTDANRARGILEWKWTRRGPGAPARYQTWRWDGSTFEAEGMRTTWPPE